MTSLNASGPKLASTYVLLTIPIKESWENTTYIYITMTKWTRIFLLLEQKIVQLFIQQGAMLSIYASIV